MGRGRPRLVILGALLAGMLALFLGIHTGPARERVLRMVVERASAAGRLSIGTLDYRIWRGVATARDVRFEPADEGALVSVRVDEVRVRWIPLRSVEILASRPELELRSVPGDGKDEPRVVEPSLPAWISALRVEDAEVRFLGPESLVVLFPLDVDLRRDPASGAARGTILLEGGNVTLDGRSIDIRRVEAEALLAGGELQVRAREIETDAGDVRGIGRVDTLSPFVGGFDLDFSLDAAPLGKFLLEGDAEKIEGRLEGTARLELGEDALASNGEAEAAGFVIRGVGPVDGDARWDLRSDLLQVDARFRRGDSRMELDAVLDFVRSEQAFTGSLDAPSMNALLREAGAAKSPWDASVRARLSGRMARFSPDTLEGRGEVSLSGAHLVGRVEVDAEPGRILIDAREMEFPGGRARVRARIDDFRTAAAEYELAIRDLSTTVEPFVDGYSNWVAGEVRVTGRAEGPLGEPASIRNSMRVESDEFRLRGAPFFLYARLDHRGTDLDLERLSLATAEDGTAGELWASGEVDFGRRRLDIRGSLESFPLHQLASAGGVAATATGSFGARGSFERPLGDAAIELTPAGEFEADLPPVRLEMRSDGALVTAGLARLDSGALLAEARVPLDGDYLLEGEIDLDALPWAELSSNLPSRVPELSAIEVSGDAEILVPLAEPSRLRGHVAVERASVEIRERTISTSSFDLEVRRDVARVNDLALLYEGEALAVDGALGLVEGAETRLGIAGNVPLEIAEMWLPGRGVEGLLRLDLELSGSLRDPRLLGEIEIAGGRLIDAVGARDAARSVENLRMRAKAVGTRIDVEALEGDLLGGELVASGSIPVPGAKDAAAARLDFDVSGLDVARLAESLRGSRAVATAISVGGELTFPEGGLGRIEASGEIQEVLLASEGGVVYLVERAEWRYDAAGIRVDEIHLEGDRTDLRVNLGPPGGEGGEALAVSVDGRVDLQFANAVLPDRVYLAGIAELDVVVARAQGVQLLGSASVSEGELAITDPAFAVTGLSAELELDSGLIRVRNLTARAGGGTLAGGGAVRIPGAGGEESALRLELEADRVGIEYPEGMKSAVSASLTFESREGGYRLSGEVDILQALYQRRISPERELIDALRRQTLELKGEPGLTGRIDLDLAISTERDVVVDNNLGEMSWDASLLVTGTLAAPEVSGTLSASPGGSLAFLGNTYEIENARVDLDSYPLEPPELDIRARTKAGGREIVLSMAGPTDNLRTNLESPTDPALSRGDAASLLLTGRTLEEVEGEEADILGQEAAGYLGTSLAGLTESSLAGALPFSTVRLEPGIVGSETDPGVRFSLGRALTEDLFLTYSIGLDDPEKQLWIIDYSLPRRLKLRAIREDSNTYTGGLSQEVLFDFYDRPKRLDAVPKPEIAAIEIEGVLSLPTEEIDDAIGYEVGDGYDYWKAREDADRLVKELRSRGLLSAQVEPYTRPPKAGPGEPVTLVYEVDRGPTVSISWSGDPPPEDLKTWALRRFEGFVPPRPQALRVGRELRWELMSRGHYQAEVEAVVEELEGHVDVLYQVVLGPKGKGVEIRIEGNENVSDDDIERLLPPTGSAEFFELVLGRTEELREELRLLYAGEGFLESEPRELTTRFDPDSEELFVVIAIEEGDAFRVGEIEVEGASSLPPDRLRSELELEPGAPFQFLAHLRDRRRVASLYRREGFPDVRVRSSLRRGERRVDVLFAIDEGARVRVGEIRIVGARATREGVIRGAVTFESGDPLRLSDLTETQRRLYNLRVFRSVDVRPEASREDGVRDVVIELTELPDLRVGYGGRYNTEDHLEVTGELELTNLLGTGRQLGLFAFANRRLTETRATFSVPSFFGRDVGSSVYVGRETEEGEGFDSLAWSATFQQGRRLFSTVLAQWSFTHRQSIVTSEVFGLDLEADRSVLSFSLIEDTRSSLTRPTRGRFWNATLQFAPDFLGSDLRFIRLYGQFFLYRPLWKDVVWASTYRAGIANAFDQVLLETDRFRAGGPSSVRGYPVNELGPVDPIAGRVIGGEGVVVMNQELRMPLFWRLGGIAFYDVGNVFLEWTDFNPFDLRHTTGVGVSVDLPVGLVTVDWAVLLNPQPGLARTRWVFTFGYSF